MQHTKGMQQHPAGDAVRTAGDPALLASLKAAFDAFAIVTVADRDGRITYANERFSRLCGYSQDELLGADHRIVNSGHHPPEFFEALWTTIGEGRVWRGEIRERARDGSLHWLDTTIVPLPGADGRPSHFVSIRTDITERKLREQLRQAHSERRDQVLFERFRAIVEAESQCVKIVSPQGIVLEMNDAGLEMLEAGGREQVVGHPVTDWIAPEDRALFAERTAGVLRGETAHVKYRIRGIRGTCRWVESRAVALRGADGKPDAVLSVTADISRELAAAQLLRRQAHMLDAIGDTVVATDARGAIIYVNRTACEQYGWEPDGLVGRHVNDVCATPPFPEVVGQVAAEGTFSGEFERRRGDGSLFMAQVTISAFLDDEGAVAGYVGVSRDLTPVKEAQRRLELNNRAVQMLADCNQAILRAASEREMLDGVCRIIHDTGSYLMVQAAYALDDAGKSFALQAHAGPLREEMKSLRVSWGDGAPCAGGPAAHAMRRREVVVVEDVESEPLMRCWLGHARANGYRSIACLPLVDGERAFGVLLLYAARPAVAWGEGSKLLRELANNLSFGIVNLRARAERRRIREAAQAIAGSVVPGGHAFLDELASRLAASLDARAAVVARYTDATRTRLGTLAAVAGGRSLGAVEWAVADMPPQLVLDGHCRIVAGQHSQCTDWELARRTGGSVFLRASLASQQAGEPVGMVILAFDRMPIPRDTVAAVLRMFAARAAAEIERVAADEKLGGLNAELEERVRRRTHQLSAANQELESFSYSVSHDLRSPLAVINGFARLLEEDAATTLGERSRHALARIRAGTAKMEELIEGLLALAHVSRAPLAWTAVDLSGLAGEVLAELRHAQPREGVVADVDAGVVVPGGDPRLLRQVLANLLGNAWKFTSRQPRARIRFGCEQEGGERVYFVSDDGPGFDAGYADKLFGAFQRLHTSAEFPGTGIGLATVKRIVQRHGGRVWAQSGAGGGARFCFTLGSVPMDDEGTGAPPA